MFSSRYGQQDMDRFSLAGGQIGMVKDCGEGVIHLFIASALPPFRYWISL